MTRELAILQGQDPVGVVRSEQGLWSLAYDPRWLISEQSFALAPSLPLSTQVLTDSADDKPVQWFFDNLLPEGSVREALARYSRIPASDIFGLLERHGDESAGALTLLPVDAPAPGPGRYEPLPPLALRELLAGLPSVPLIAVQGRARMSLAGAQHKLGVHRRGDELLLPVAAPSSWILKPENARAAEFPHCPANEHFCMSLARRVGIPAPVTELWHLPEPLYLVQRYDRVLDEDGGVRRLHQIDLCQLLGKWPGYKYEADGGATFVETYQALDATRQPAVARRQLLRWLIFNYLIGNSDAHAKNIAFLVSANGLSLAPAYDLLSVRSYGVDHDYLAMTIDGEARYEWVESSHWDALARRLGLKPALLSNMRRDLAAQLPAAAEQLLGEPCFTDEEREFLGEVVRTVKLLCRRMM